MTDNATLTDELARRSTALREALDTGGAQLDPALTARARKLSHKIDERLGLGGANTVVALAGATGSGKSSIFNALVGERVAVVGARRPTTATPNAAIWGSADAAPLLDWLEVAQRHHVGTEVDDFDGVVLLDLPDFDSRVVEHRREAERVLQLSDVFIWVTDPQKYADAVLHNDFIATSANHTEVSVVVLNQVDTLSDDEVARCVADLERLLADDGMRGVEVLAMSARTGRGIARLHELISSSVAGHSAARRRLVADVRSAATALRKGVADIEPAVPADAEDQLTDSLAKAAGIPIVLYAIERDYRREAASRGGWLFTRWGHRLRPDPLKRLRLKDRSPVEEADIRAVLGRSSIPPPTPAAASAVALATHQLGDRLSAGLPQRWATAVEDAAAPQLDDLTDALDQAVLRTPLRSNESPWWWTLVNVLQWQLGLIAILGLLWYVVLGVMGWLQLPQPDTPFWGPLPVPFIMLAGGLLLGLLLVLLIRPIARFGARRRSREVGGRLRLAIREVAGKRVVDPAREVLERHRRTREALDRAGR